MCKHEYLSRAMQRKISANIDTNTLPSNTIHSIALLLRCLYVVFVDHIHTNTLYIAGKNNNHTDFVNNAIVTIMTTTTTIQ